MTMDLLQILSLTAGTLTTAAFLPQAIKTIRTRDTRSISLVMYIVFTLGVLLWLVYGAATGQWAITISNLITFLLASVILVLKIRHH